MKTLILMLSLTVVAGCATYGQGVRYRPHTDTDVIYTPSYRESVKTGITEMRVRNTYRCYKIKRENGGRGRCR